MKDQLDPLVRASEVQTRGPPQLMDCRTRLRHITMAEALFAVNSNAEASNGFLA